MSRMKIMLLCLGVCSVIAVGTYIYANGNNGNPIQEIAIESNYVYTVEKDQIGQFADLVVLGVPQDNLEKRKFDVKYFPKDPRDNSDAPPAIENFQGFTRFSVDEVYKNATGLKISAKSEVTVAEPIALLQDSEGKKIIRQERYDELKAQKKYVLFLKKSPDHDYYYIVRDNDGMELISNERELEQEVKGILQKHNIGS